MEPIIHLLSWVVVLMVCAFVFWRRLQSELPEEYLLRMILMVILLGVVGGRSLWWLNGVTQPGWGVNWLWQISSHPGINWVGVILGGVLVMRKLDSKYRHILGEIGEAYVEAIMWGALLVSWGGVMWRWGYRPVGSAILALAAIGGWYWLRSRYRRFGWYSSGKVGFMWWAGLGLLSLSQLLSLWWFSLGHGRLGGVVYNGLLLLISAVGIYTISGRNFIGDIRGTRKRFVRDSQSNKEHDESK